MGYGYYGQNTSGRMTQENYIGVFSLNYIGIYTSEEALDRELPYYDEPQIKRCCTKNEASSFIYDGLMYVLHPFEPDEKISDHRIYRMAVNHRHFISTALQNRSYRNYCRDILMKERHQKKKQSKLK
ncbi:MAG: hypothetical protein IJ657_08285 [Acidaminococcaceae bacterium]|nr:hypothetical protein [Acidaminococcaceae bacterium]